MKKLEIVVLVLILNCTVLAADTHFVGTINKDWLTAGNWDAGLPTSSTNPYIDKSADANVTGTGAAGFTCYVDKGRTLTIGSGGYLTLSSSSAAALRLGDVNDANLVLNGGTLKHAYRYGGDFKCGNGTGKINISINSGTWLTRILSLGEAIDPANPTGWGTVSGVVGSTIDVLQTGGTVNLETGYAGTGGIYIPYSSGANATYTMNGGTINFTKLVFCQCGTTGTPCFGTFNMNNGTVTVKDIRLGYKGSGSGVGGTTNSPGSIGKLVQTNGTIKASGSVWAGEGNKQGVLSSSGGNLAITGNLVNGLDGVGTIELVGTDPNITVKGTYTQNAKSKLKVVIKPSGVAKLKVTGAATLSSGTFIEVDVDESVSLTDGAQFTILTTNAGITSGSFYIIGGACGYFTAAASGTNLVLTYHADIDVTGRCHVICSAQPQYDFDGNCIVDWKDMALFVTGWLECNSDSSTVCQN